MAKKLSCIKDIILIIRTDIVELEAKLRFQPDRSRILGASRVWDQDWGLPRVKCGTGGCNPTILALASLVTS